MAGKSRHGPGLIDELALALARGVSMAQWCRENKVPERTGRAWRSRPGFRAKVDAHRAEINAETIGRLTASSTAAVATLANLMIKSPSETTRLQAASKILSALVPIASHMELAERIAAIEASLKKEQDERQPHATR